MFEMLGMLLYRLQYELIMKHQSSFQLRKDSRYHFRFGLVIGKRLILTEEAARSVLSKVESIHLHHNGDKQRQQRVHQESQTTSQIL